MAEETVRVRIEFEGGDRAAQSAQRASQGVQNLGDVATRAQAAALQFGQRLQAATAFANTLAQAAGGPTASAMTLLISRMTQGSVVGAQLGSVMGPTGAGLGAVLGALPAVLGRVSEGFDRGTSAIQAQITEAQRLGRSYQDLRRDMERAAQAQQDFTRLSAGAGSGVEQAAFAQQQANLAELARQAESGDVAALNELRRQGRTGVTAQARGARTGVRGMAEDIAGAFTGDQSTEGIADLAELQTIRRIREQAEAEASRRQALVAPAEARDEAALQRQITETNRGSRGGHRDRSFVDREGYDIAGELEQELQDQRLNNSAEWARVVEEGAAHQLELTKAQGIEEERQAADKRERLARALADQKEAAREAEDVLESARDKQHEAAQQQLEDIQAVSGVIVGGLTDALSAVISGQKSAEEAFKGMLASFLEYISEQAMLEAIKEYAAAIQSFANYKYDSGALHLAAGVAYTAVAVAAGAGAVALSAPSAPPEDQASDQQSGSSERGGDINVYYNAPVITAGTRAELGREMRSMIATADRMGI